LVGATVRAGAEVVTETASGRPKLERHARLRDFFDVKLLGRTNVDEPRRVASAVGEGSMTV
jgi:hypothetical protein